jgi:hypothetical protein
LQAAQQSQAGNPNPTPDQLKILMAQMMPMYKAILDITFEDMCINKAVYSCLVTNSDKCQDKQTVSTASPNNPVSMAQTYGTQIDCICDVCPGAKKAFADLSTTLMSLIFTAFSGIAAGIGSNQGSTTPQPEAMKKQILTGMCPFAGLQRCFEANPTQCGKMTSGDQMKSGMGAIGLAGSTNLTALMTECGKMGISVASPAPPAKVSMMMKIAGLDYAKVISNAAIQKQLIDGIKAKFVAKMTGYRTEDFEVTLSAGSVRATVSVTPVPGSTAENLQKAMGSAKTSLADEILAEVKAMPNIASVTQDGQAASQLTITAQDPAVQSAGAGFVGKALTSQGSAVVSFMVVLLAQLVM